GGGDRFGGEIHLAEARKRGLGSRGRRRGGRGGRLRGGRSGVRRRGLGSGFEGRKNGERLVGFRRQLEHRVGLDLEIRPDRLRGPRRRLGRSRFGKRLGEDERGLRKHRSARRRGFRGDRAGRGGRGGLSRGSRKHGERQRRGRSRG